ncbi:MAG: DUF169 domain-containing protein [Oscillospiraceae bacterium]|nr:DUF169 domain-containing protein [Oscillospiraceae bacterium]
MEIRKYNEYGRRLEELYKLRSMPFGVKFYEKASDVPEGTVFPKKDLKKHMSLCQAWAYSRMKGMAIGLTKEDHWCWNPLIAFGAVECVPGQPQFDQVIKILGINDPQKAADFFVKFPRFPLGKYEAVVSAPLKDCAFEPDVILIYAEAAKINHMIRCIKSVTGDVTHSVFDGIDSCIYATLPSIMQGEYRVTFPDPGDRERALARDDEVILTVPAGRMEEFMTGVEGLCGFMPFNDRLLEFNLDFPHPPFYNTLFEMWGLDGNGEEWDFKTPDHLK